MKNFFKNFGMYFFRGLLAVIPLALVWIAIRILHELIDKRVLNFLDRKSTRLNSSHSQISYAVFCLNKAFRHIFGSPLQVCIGEKLEENCKTCIFTIWDSRSILI